MKTLFGSCCSLAAMLLFLAGTAAAQNPAGSLEVGGLFGGTVSDGSSRYEMNSVNWGGRIGYYATQDLSLEAFYSYQKTSLRNEGDFANDAAVHVIMAEVAQHFGTGPVRPFIAGGLGTWITADTNVRTGTYFAMDLGGGVKWFLTDNLLVRGDARWLINTEGSSQLNNFWYTGGVSFLFE